MPSAQILTLTGSLVIAPQGAPSGIAAAPIPLALVQALELKSVFETVLDDDTTVDVDFGGLSEVNVLLIQVVGGGVKLRVTSEDGALQTLPIDVLGLVINPDTPFTALDVTRKNGITGSVSVYIFLGKVP